MTIKDQRLIEDYLPLGTLNSIASKEKLHPRRYVELIHYWPARRPISACRAAIYAALTPATRDEEDREKAATFVARLAAYSPDQETVAQAQQRIQEAHDGRTPKVLDLFAGGGAIPLEAARLGCESHAVDYNPVAHLIELCTLVYPQKYGTSLADDFEEWSSLVLDRMRNEIGDLYPKVRLPRSKDVFGKQYLGDTYQTEEHYTDPVAYIWVRTVPCKRPGCSATVPLVRQSWLRKKNGAIASIPDITADGRLDWYIKSGDTAGEVSRYTEQT